MKRSSKGQPRKRPRRAVVLVFGESEHDRGKDIGRVENAKEASTKALRPPREKRKVRDYHEANSIEIAHNIVSLDLLASFEEDHRKTPGKGVADTRTRSSSFGAFRRKALALPRVENGQRAKGATSGVGQPDIDADPS